MSSASGLNLCRLFACWLNAEEVDAVRDAGQGIRPLCHWRKATSAPSEEEDGPRGIGSAHGSFGGHALQSGARETFSDAADALPHRLGVQRWPGVLLFQRQEAPRLRHRTTSRAQTLSGKRLRSA